jgi:hypothetical protein
VRRTGIILPADQGAAAADPATLEEIKHDGFCVVARKDGERVLVRRRWPTCARWPPT